MKPCSHYTAYSSPSLSGNMCMLSPLNALFSHRPQHVRDTRPIHLINQPPGNVTPGIGQNFVRHQTPFADQSNPLDFSWTVEPSILRRSPRVSQLPFSVSGQRFPYPTSICFRILSIFLSDGVSPRSPEKSS